MEKRRINWFVIFVVFLMGIGLIISGIQLNIFALIILGSFETLIGLLGVYAGIKESKKLSPPKERICPNCGTPYDDSTNICSNCGLQL